MADLTGVPCGGVPGGVPAGGPLATYPADQRRAAGLLDELGLVLAGQVEQDVRAGEHFRTPRFRGLSW
jgi:hypothetical protein